MGYQPGTCIGICVSSSKGGVGKTTTVISLGDWFARHGLRTLLLDLDGQSHIATALQYEISGPTIADVLKGQVPLGEAIQQVRENLWIVPSDTRLAEAEVTLQQKPGRGTLARALATVARDFAICIADTAPASSLSAVSQNGLYMADYVICPVKASSLSVGTIPLLYSALLDLETDLKWSGKLAMVIPTFVDRRRIEDNEALKTIREMLGDDYGQLYQGEIRENIALARAAANGRTIFEYAPNSAGAQDYEQIAWRLAQLIGMQAKGGVA